MDMKFLVWLCSLDKGFEIMHGEDVGNISYKIGDWISTESNLFKDVKLNLSFVTASATFTQYDDFCLVNPNFFNFVILSSKNLADVNGIIFL